MKLHVIILIICILTSAHSRGQNFKGRITDKDGEALYGSTIYVKEINQGLVCNEDGYYQTTLTTGNYNIEYKCLGFKGEERKIQIEQNKITTVDITLTENPFTLKEITVSNQEDPAYPIMRKAIERAPLYAGAAKEYTADVYIKVNAELLKVSSLIDKMAKKEEGVKLSDFKDRLFTQESFNEIQFTTPDKYKQTVKAFSSSIPDNMSSTDAMGMLSTSLYMPKVNMYVSPLNPKAFSYYKFRYEGFLEENGITINKIKVEPKMNDPILFEGYIYIADNTWHIYSAELNTNAYGTRQAYTVTFQELATNTYLPITYLIAADISILGIKATMNYYSSLTYTDIKVNDEIVQELTEKKKTKKREFEIQRRDSLYTIISDSLATKRDSTYWANIRVVPLDEREIRTFIIKDSIQQHLDSARNAHHNPGFSFENILNGGKIGTDSSKVIIRYEGLLNGALKEFNFVDGWWLGQRFQIESKIGKHNRLVFSPHLYYVLSRKRLLGGADVDFKYAPLRLGNLKISAGSVSEDFNPDGIHRFNNFSSSLIYGRNYNYFYQKDYVSAFNHIDLANGLKLTTGIEIARRRGLSNSTDYTWGKKKEIKPNIFPDERFDKTAIHIGLDYTPYSYYMIRDGAKTYVKQTSPTFYIKYDQGFSSWQTNNSKYHKLWGGLYQNIKLSEFSNLDYQLEGGKFIGNRDKIHFVDYQHFNTSNVTVNMKSPFTSFMLLDNYIASTNRYWLRTNINYESKYILLKRLPFLQGKMFNETLHLKNLYTPDMKLYTEAGYSLNFTKLLNVGAFVSFKKAKYQDFGIRVLFDLDNIKKMIE